MDVQELINQYNSGVFTGDIIASLTEKRTELGREKECKVAEFHAACSAYLEDVQNGEKRINDRIAQLENEKAHAEKEVSDARVWVARAVAEGKDSVGALFHESIVDSEKKMVSITREIESFRSYGSPGNPHLYADVMSKLSAAIDAVKRFNQDVGIIVKFATEQRGKWDNLIPNNKGVFSATYDEVNLLRADRQLQKVTAHFKKDAN